MLRATGLCHVRSISYTQCHFPVQDPRSPGALLSLHSKLIFPLDAVVLSNVSGLFLRPAKIEAIKNMENFASNAAKKERSVGFIRKRWKYIHFSEHNIFFPSLMPALGLNEIVYECRRPVISTIPAGSCSSYCYLGVVRLTHSSSYTWLSVAFWSPLLWCRCSGHSQSLWSSAG